MIKRPKATAAGIAALATALLLPTAAQAEPGQIPDWNVGGTVAAPFPDAAAEHLSACPSPNEFPLIFPALLDENGQPVLDEEGNQVPDEAAEPLGRRPADVCIIANVTNGELKLGNTVANVSDLQIAFGFNTKGDIVVGGGDGDGGGGPAAIKIPGGILGIPELDPLWDATLGLLSVSATPSIGSPAPGNSNCTTLECMTPDPAQMLGFWLLGVGENDDARDLDLSIPLSIDLNNTLFGPNCTIDEFNINLTTGETAPPEGVDPITGDSVGTDHRVTRHYSASGVAAEGTAFLGTQAGTRWVDNAFSVPGPKKCDLLVGGLLNAPFGLLDSVIGSQVGLPSPAGNNLAAFDIDWTMAWYGSQGLYGGQYEPRVPILPAIPTLGTKGGLAFGDVPVGSSKTLVGTVTATGLFGITPLDHRPVGIADGVNQADQFELLSTDCDRTMARGETCTAEVRFTPTSTGNKAGRLDVPSDPRLQEGAPQASFALTGRGV